MRLRSPLGIAMEMVCEVRGVNGSDGALELVEESVISREVFGGVCEGPVRG